MASALLNLCENHKISIWAAFGTLLGCVRHEGFIPWDDDLDFVIMRDGFEKLRKIAINNKMITSDIYFDLSRPEVIKIRYKDTCMIQKNYKLSKRVDQSAWIDIFCLDRLPEKYELLKSNYNIIRKLVRVYKNNMQMCFGYLNGLVNKGWHLYCIIYSILIGKRMMYEKINAFASQEVNADSHIIACIMEDAGNFSFESNKMIKYNIEWYDETVFLPFQDISLPCPKSYHEVLTSDFGENYLVPLRLPATHSSSIIDVNRSYKLVIDEIIHSIPWYKRFLYKI